MIVGLSFAVLHGYVGKDLYRQGVDIFGLYYPPAAPGAACGRAGDSLLKGSLDDACAHIFGF